MDDEGESRDRELIILEESLSIHSFVDGVIF